MTIEKAIEKKDLKKLAKEMNNVMGLEPAIDLTLDTDDLQEAIISNMGEVYETDGPHHAGEDEEKTYFSKSAWTTLAALGCEVAVSAEPESTTEPEPEPTPEPEPEKKTDEKKPSKRSTPAKPPAEKSKPPKEQVTAEPKPPKEKKYTRLQSIAQGIAAGKKQKKNWTIDDLTAVTNKLYVDSGGVENPREAKFFVNIAVACMAELGFLEYEPKTGKISFK